eukprot:2800648-Pleurochrysis_carterae.AAC.1
MVRSTWLLRGCENASLYLLPPGPMLRYGQLVFGLPRAPAATSCPIQAYSPVARRAIQSDHARYEISVAHAHNDFGFRYRACG